MPQGLAVNVVSADEAERAQYLICLKKEDRTFFMFDDDQFGICCACGAEVRFRPTAPTKPPRMCLGCFHEMAKGPH